MVTHPSTNWAQHWLTSLIRPMSLTTTPSKLLFFNYVSVRSTEVHGQWNKLAVWVIGWLFFLQIISQDWEGLRTREWWKFFNCGKICKKNRQHRQTLQKPIFFHSHGDAMFTQKQHIRIRCCPTKVPLSAHHADFFRLFIMLFSVGHWTSGHEGVEAE